MPKKMSITDEAISQQAPDSSVTHAKSERSDATMLEEKLDAVLAHLARMDKRDRLRTWGGLLRGIIAVIPLFLFLWSSVYLYQHGKEIISLIASESAKQAAQYSQGQGESLLQRMQNMLPHK